MSFGGGRSISLDQLPDARIYNPLRKGSGGGGGEPRRRPVKTQPAPAAPPPAFGRAAPPPRSGGLFSRIAPAQSTQRRDAAADSASDDDEGDEDEGSGSDDEDDDDRPVRRRREHDVLPSGPFAKVANTNRCSFQFVAAFKDVNGSLSKSSASVTISFSEVLKHADTQDNISRLDPRRTIPIYVRVTGTSLSDEFLRVCALEVYDASGKPMYSKFVHKHNNAETAVATGYPMFLFHKGGQNNILFNPPELSSDHKTYWTFTMETLEKNTSLFMNPTTGEQYVIIKKESGCALLMQYALSERNEIVTNPPLLENPAYQSPNDPDNIRLPVYLYNQVKAAYRKKLGEIAASSFDLSSVKVVLKPLELAKEMWVEHLRSPQPGAVVTNIGQVWGHVALEVHAHIPSMDEEDAAPVRGGGGGGGALGTGADDGSDDEL